MRYLIGILLIALSFSEDFYPFFTNPEKQLEFEENKIYVNETDSKEMILSGGSQFNFAYLIDSSQPLIVPSDIATNYKYIYTFEIKHNGEILNELQLLKLVGLNDKANELETDFKKELENYYINRTYTAKKDLTTQAFAIPLLLVGVMMNIGTLDQIYDSSNNNLGALWHIFGVGATVVGSFAAKNINYKEYPPIPTYQQKYTNEQLQALSESYNLKIYNEIKNK